MLKRRKGEIATLLTLGLVILGGVLAIGSSVFLSQQKTSTSTRAAGGCGSGNNFSCDANEGYNKSKCPDPNLEFACCVVDQGRGGCVDDFSFRYRWYGCTGQHCKNTKISTSGGPGHLVACPAGISKSVIEGCYDTPNGLSAKPAGAEEPIETPPRAGCEHTLNERKCKIIDETWSYIVDKEDKKWCCPPGGGSGGSEKNDCEEKGYQCVSKSIGRSDNGSCQVVLGINYISHSLSCGDVNKVCCKKSGTSLPGDEGITTQQCEYKDLQECDKSLCINCKECVDGSYKCEIENEETESDLPVVPPAAPAEGEQTITDTITPNPSSQCTNKECSDPHKGIWYSYKCTGVPQTIQGVVQCPKFTFYQGKDCNWLYMAIGRNSIQDMENKYCSAKFTNFTRNITINYNFTLTKAIDISPNNPYVNVSILDNSNTFLASELKSNPPILSINISNFPQNGMSNTTSVISGTNVICIAMHYVRTSTSSRYLYSCGNVENGVVNISMDISNDK